MGYLKTLSLILVLVSWNSSIGSATQKNEKTLYHRLGGKKTIAKMVDHFVEGLAKDSRINANPSIKAVREKLDVKVLKKQVTDFVCQETGGPCKIKGNFTWSGQLKPDLQAMEWIYLTGLMMVVLDQHHIPKKEQSELLQLFASRGK